MAVIFFSPKKLASLKQRILEGWLQPFLWKWTFIIYTVERYAYTQITLSWDDVCQSYCFHKSTFWHVYVLVPVYFIWPCVPHVTYVTSHRGYWPLLIRVSGITWRGSKRLEASRNVILHTRYVSTCVGAKRRQNTINNVE
jgi:hypothetical protein